MDRHSDHKQLIAGCYKHLESIFAGSKEAVCLYLDDSNKICNKKFAQLLGYNSPDEWAKVEPFLESFVAYDSQASLTTSYLLAIDKMLGSKLRVLWRAKTGKIIPTDVIIIPVIFKDHLFALHLVSP